MSGAADFADAGSGSDGLQRATLAVRAIASAFSNSGCFALL